MNDSTTSSEAGQIAESLITDRERRRKLLGYARRRFGIGPADAEDLLQDTVLRLLRYQGYVRNPEGFVFAVFRSLCVRSTLAKAATRGRRSDKRLEVGDGMAVMEDLHARMAVREGLSAISPRCRRILEAYYLLGLSLREVASAAHLADSSAAKTINRCLRRLQECFV